MTVSTREAYRKIGQRISSDRKRVSCGAAVVGLLSLLGGCGGGGSPANPTAAIPSSPQSYLAPFVAGTTGLQIAGPQIYSIDDVNAAFTQTSYSLSPPFQEGAQILSAGIFTSSARGLLDLSLTASYAYDTNSERWVPTNPISPAGGFAVELSGQAGALVQLDGQPVLPLVPTSVCPNLSSSESFNYLTIPAPLTPPAGSLANKPPYWDPSAETAYGSVDIGTSGSTVSLKKNQQFTFPFNGTAGSTPANPSASSDAVCGTTAYGNTISIPGQIVVTNPGNSNVSPPQAIANIGATGLLVENNGLLTSGQAQGTYQNSLGAGTGAVGLPVPSSNVDTGATYTAALVGAQYLGFVYGTGASGSGNTPFSSHVASFGFPTGYATTCPQMVPNGATNPIYGGDFPQDVSSSSSNGFGQCDLVVYLGSQSPSQNGLYTNVNVVLGSTYLGNSMHNDYSFTAVAIAGQLGTKSAIFVLGVDPISNQAWSIYLFQSN